MDPAPPGFAQNVVASGSGPGVPPTAPPPAQSSDAEKPTEKMSSVKSTLSAPSQSSSGTKVAEAPPQAKTELPVTSAKSAIQMSQAFVPLVQPRLPPTQGPLFQAEIYNPNAEVEQVGVQLTCVERIMACARAIEVAVDHGPAPIKAIFVIVETYTGLPRISLILGQ